MYINANPINYLDEYGWFSIYVHGTHVNAPKRGDNDDKFAREFAKRVWNDDDAKVITNFEWNSWYMPNTPFVELNDDDISRQKAALKLADYITNYLKAHPEDCNNINLMGHSHGGNVIILALAILKKRGIHINGIATFGTPVRPDYQIPEGSFNSFYNFYGEWGIKLSGLGIQLTGDYTPIIGGTDYSPLGITSYGVTEQKRNRKDIKDIAVSSLTAVNIPIPLKKDEIKPIIAKALFDFAKFESHGSIKSIEVIQKNSNFCTEVLPTFCN
jgi:hypothetical protein